jgi:hypothetical protein
VLPFQVMHAIHWGPWGWIAWAAFALAIPFFLSMARRLWRNRLPRLQATPSWWVWGEPLWRGWVRSMPVAAALTVVWVVPLPLGTVLSTGTLAFTIYAITVGGGLFLTIGLAVTIALWNFPHQLVPPHLRSEPGALDQWTGQTS